MTAMLYNLTIGQQLSMVYIHSYNSMPDKFHFEWGTKFLQTFVDSVLPPWLLVRANEKSGLKGDMS